MDAIDLEFGFVAGSVERAVGVQRAACARILDDETASGRSLAAHIDQAYAAVAQRVGERRTAYASAPDDTVRTDAVIEMRRLVWDVRRLQSNLGWLEAAQRSPLDLGTRYFVEDAARALIAPDVEVTVVPSDAPSYWTTSNPWEPLIQTWAPGSVKGRTVVVVELPRREQRSGLLHPLIVHELAHGADSQHAIVDRIWDAAQKRKRLSARFANAVEAFAAARNVDPAQANATISQALRAWITEAFCDSVAVHHLGPTYLYSFAAEVVAGSLDELATTHPTARQRVRLLLAALDRLGWTELMASADSSLHAWLHDLGAASVDQDDLARFLSGAIDELRAVVRSHAEELLGPRVFRPNPEELEEVRLLLEAKIPPAQRRGGSVARETIMLECWHTALAGAGGGPKALARAPDAPELSELLPAALELSAVASAWGTS